MSKTKDNFSPFARQCFVTCAVCSGGVAQGCAAGFPAVLLPQLAAAGVGPRAQSWIASALAVSIFAGVLMASPLMGGRGRKAAAHAVACTGALGWAIMAIAPNVATLIIARALQGISFGVYMPLRPVLIAEYTSPRYRGSFLATVSLSQAVGIVFVHSVGSQLQWQHAAAACGCFPLASLVMTLYSPESPGWLAARGHYDASRAAFRWLRGDGEDDELDQMITARRLARRARDDAEKTSTFEGLKRVAEKKEMYKPMLLAVHVLLLSQLCGSITLANYAHEILAALTGDAARTGLWTVELDALRLVASALAVAALARARRRVVLLCAGALCVASHAAIAGYHYAKARGGLPYDAAWIPVLLLNIQMASLSFGVVPMAVIVTGEMFPLEYRSALSALSGVTVSATMFAVLKTFPWLCAGAGLHGAYAVYGGGLAYALAVTWLLLPETRGRTLQQIEDHFRGMSSVPDEVCELQSLGAEAGGNREKL